MKDTANPGLAGLLAASPATAIAIATGFFGWLTRTFNDVRWLQSEQLKELKIHNKVMENQMRKIVDKGLASTGIEASPSDEQDGA